MTENLTPLEKARLAKKANAEARKTEANEVINESEMDKPLEKIVSKPKWWINETKLDLFLEKLPMIDRYSMVCEFIIEHFALHNALKQFMDRRAEGINKAGIYKVFEKYGILKGSEGDVKKLTSYIYHTFDEVDEICNYLTLNNIEFDRDLFIIKNPTDGGNK